MCMVPWQVGTSLLLGPGERESLAFALCTWPAHHLSETSLRALSWAPCGCVLTRPGLNVEVTGGCRRGCPGVSAASHWAQRTMIEVSQARSLLELESRKQGESAGEMSGPPRLILVGPEKLRGPEGSLRGRLVERRKGVILRPRGPLGGEPSWQPRFLRVPLASGTTKPKCKGISFLRKTHTYTF